MHLKHCSLTLNIYPFYIACSQVHTENAMSRLDNRDNPLQNRWIHSSVIAVADSMAFSATGWLKSSLTPELIHVYRHIAVNGISDVVGLNLTYSNSTWSPMFRFSRTYCRCSQPCVTDGAISTVDVIDLLSIISTLLHSLCSECNTNNSDRPS